MLTCTRRIEFDAAHRVMEHESKCKYLHGHRYAVEASFAASALDSLGRVIDFGTVTTLLGSWINTNWDHTTILHAADAELGAHIASVTGQRIFYLDTNPTAENMASYLLQHVCPLLFAGSTAQCVRIKLYETPNCYAEVTY